MTKLFVLFVSSLHLTNGFTLNPSLNEKHQWTVAFVQKRAGTPVDQAYLDDLKSDLDLGYPKATESILDKMHAELQGFLSDENHQELDETESIIDEQKDDDPRHDYLDFQNEHFPVTEAKEAGISFGMMGSHSKPLVEPSGLGMDEEECEETYHDFATGDELCWNGDTLPAAAVAEVKPNKQVTSSSDPSKKKTSSGDDKISFEGGMMGSHRKQLKDPTKMDEQEEEECKEVYTDFATGDDLCWT